jgi:ATP-binding cassette subfamily F protein uup
LLIVSHDRYFLDKLVDHLFVLDGKGGVRDVLGSSLQFRDMLAESSPENVKEKESIEPKTKNNSTTKISFKEKQQFTELERDIPLWEEKRVQLELQMSQCTDHSELIELSNQLAELNSKIEEGTLLWLTLAEKMG